MNALDKLLANEVPAEIIIDQLDRPNDNNVYITIRYKNGSKIEYLTSCAELTYTQSKYGDTRLDLSVIVNKSREVKKHDYS
jgi:hypothetical protein